MTFDATTYFLSTKAFMGLINSWFLIVDAIGYCSVEVLERKFLQSLRDVEIYCLSLSYDDATLRDFIYRLRCSKSSRRYFRNDESS